MLSVSTVFSRFIVLLFGSTRLSINSSLHFKMHFGRPSGKSCLPKRNLVYDTCILMLSDVEFNSEQNGMIVKLKSKNIRLYRM